MAALHCQLTWALDLYGHGLEWLAGWITPPLSGRSSRPTQVLELLRPSTAVVEIATLPEMLNHLCMAQPVAAHSSRAVAGPAPFMALSRSFTWGAFSGPPQYVWEA